MSGSNGHAPQLPPELRGAALLVGEQPILRDGDCSAIIECACEARTLLHIPSMHVGKGCHACKRIYRLVEVTMRLDAAGQPKISYRVAWRHVDDLAGGLR